MSTVHSFDYLANSAESEPTPVCVAFGDEAFLRRLVVAEIRKVVFGDKEEDVPFGVFDGKGTEWRDIVDELSTVSLFGGGRPRLVIVEQADDFVSRYRSELEAYVEKPCSSGRLILEVSAWKSNTRLYKAVDKVGLQIECRPPEISRGRRKYLDESRVRKWLVDRAKIQHGVTLQAQAAELLLELEGAEFGLLEQDLAKLALFAGAGGKVSPEMVRDQVGGWKTKTTWELIDAAVDGNSAEALRQLDRLLHAGEHPVALLGQIAWSLRRFASAARIYQQAEQSGQPVKIREALEQAGFRKWPQQALDDAEKQLKQLGRHRAGRLFRWLLNADLAMKGTHSNPHRARFMLEQLFLKLSKELGPQSKPSAVVSNR